MPVSFQGTFILFNSPILFSFDYQSIVFIRDHNHLGQEISGYIDYAHRLKVEDCTPYFEGKKKLLPKPSDLSYYNWETQTCTSNPTPNFQVIADSEAGLLFKNKRDRKTINVDPKVLRQSFKPFYQTASNLYSNSTQPLAPGSHNFDFSGILR
jgi:hypothetical protein